MSARALLLAAAIVAGTHANAFGSGAGGDSVAATTVADPPPEHVAADSTGRATADERLRLQRRGERFRAALQFRAHSRARAIVRLRLHARYPAEGWRVVERWQAVRRVHGGSIRRLRVNVDADRIRRQCRRYARCQLRAGGATRTLGSRLAHRRAVRSIPTGPERFAGGLAPARTSTEVSGAGRVYRYAVLVERGIKIDRRRFARQLRSTLFDERGWGRTGRVAFRQVADPAQANTRIILASPGLVDRLCHPLRTLGRFSCNRGPDVVLNLDRWRHSVAHWPAGRRSYRNMLVNHEIGHRLGHGHRSCPGSGRRAPVMQQQTIGLQGCRIGPWPRDAEIRSVR